MLEWKCCRIHNKLMELADSTCEKPNNRTLPSQYENNREIDSDIINK